MASVGTKENNINTAGESIIFKKDSFLLYKNHRQSMNLETGIKNQYRSYQKKAAHKLKPLKSIPNKAKQQNLADAIGVVYNFEGDMKENFNMIAKTVPDTIKTALNQVRGFSKMADNFLKSKDNAALLKQLEECLKALKACQQAYQEANKNLMDYLIDKEAPAAQLFEEGKYDLLTINPSAVTSMTSLLQTIADLDKIVESGTVRMGRGFKYVEYTNSKNKKKRVKYTAYVARLQYILNNILGGIGEGLGAISTINAVDSFLKTLPKQLTSENTTVKVVGTGTGSVTNSQGKRRTKKADYEIVITYGPDGKAECKFGVSAKGQYWLSKNKQTKTGTVKTTFQTSVLEVFIQKAESKKMLSAIEKNIFYNNLHYNLQGSSKEQYWLNRKIASAHFYDAVTGNDFKENVLFISFLDTTITIEDLFKDILRTRKYPAISLPQIGEARTGAIGKAVTEQDIIIDGQRYCMYKESKEIINSYNKIKAQITYEH